ncbi:LOW QUALITY PROTEIN: hypothetical protein HID58_025852, partial [Brassica napus]
IVKTSYVLLPSLTPKRGSVAPTRSLLNAQIIVALCLAAAIDAVEDPVRLRHSVPKAVVFLPHIHYPTQHTAIDKFMVYKLIKTSGIGVIKRILTLSAPKRSPVSRCKKMVLRFLPQLYQEASTDCLSLFRVHCNNTNVVGVVRNLPLTLNTCFLTSRYRVEITIADDTADGLFFDGIMTKLHNIITYETGHLLSGEGVNPEETQVPPFIADIVVKTYTF